MPAFQSSLRKLLAIAYTFNSVCPSHGSCPVTADIILVKKEALNRTTNQYEKLANISYDKDDGIFRCENMVMDSAIDVRGCCRRAEELFELYKVCANRRQVETICTNFLRSIEATKLSINGHLYFVPRTYMEKVDVFEDFITSLGELNLKETPLAVKKEIAEYQERTDYLIKSGCQSPTITGRWALKVQALEEKKRHYEEVLRRELNGLDDELETLRFLVQELQVRAGKKAA